MASKMRPTVYQLSTPKLCFVLSQEHFLHFLKSSLSQMKYLAASQNKSTRALEPTRKITQFISFKYETEERAFVHPLV